MAFTVALDSPDLTAFSRWCASWLAGPDIDTKLLSDAPERFVYDVVLVDAAEPQWAQAWLSAYPPDGMAGRPRIVLARVQDTDWVRLCERGADECLGAHAGSTEMLTRVRAQLSAGLANDRDAKGLVEDIAALGHDLRSPMTAVLGFAEVISAELWGGPVDPRYVAAAGDIADAGQRMMALLNPVLLAARQATDASTPSPLRVEPLDFAARLDARADALRSTANARGVRLTVRGDAPPAPVRARGDALEAGVALALDVMAHQSAPGTTLELAFETEATDVAACTLIAETLNPGAGRAPAWRLCARLAVQSGGRVTVKQVGARLTARFVWPFCRAAVRAA
ncbi:MAG: histidine kinase dimerization/phospho-acceptor domain-containing protein [Maricaulaceae bacterium]